MLLLSFQRLKLEFKLYWLLMCSIDLILVLKGRWHSFCPRGLEDVLSPPGQADQCLPFAMRLLSQGNSCTVTFVTSFSRSWLPASQI